MFEEKLVKLYTPGYKKNAKENKWTSFEVEKKPTIAKIEVSIVAILTHVIE